MTFLTLSKAAKVIGKSKSTLNRAVKSGRLSAIRNEDGTFSIDPSELARVFPKSLEERPTERQSELPRTEEINRIDMLEKLLDREKEALCREKEVSADLKEDRDRWRAQATGLLSDLRSAQEKAELPIPSNKPSILKKMSIWNRIFR